MHNSMCTMDKINYLLFIVSTKRVCMYRLKVCSHLALEVILKGGLTSLKNVCLHLSSLVIANPTWMCVHMAHI